MSIKLEEVLKREFERRHLSINQVANECSMPVSVLHSWLNGVLPSAKNLKHIQTLSKYLGLQIDSMLFDESEPTSLILFTSTFMDGDTQYKLTVEKIKGRK